MAVLEGEEVFSLDDLRRLAGHPHFDSCGLSVLNVLKIRDALAQQPQQPQQTQSPQSSQSPQSPQPQQPQQTQQTQSPQSSQSPQSPPFAVAIAGSSSPAVLCGAVKLLAKPARRAGRGLPGSGFVQRFSRMANGVVLHTNNGVHIGLALDQPPVEERGGQGSILNAAAMLDAAAKLRALPSLTASFTRQPRSGKHRTEMEEDAEVEALSLASLAVEQPALFRAVTNAEEAAKADQALRDAGENYRLTIAHEIVPTPISESSESASYLTPIQLRTAASRLRAEVAVPPFSPCTEVLRGTNLPGARARALHCDDPRFRSPWASSVDGGVGGLHDLFASCDPLFHPGMGDDRASSASSVSSFNGAEPYPLPGSVGPAPLPRGLAWLRSAWRDIIQYHIVRGQRRRGESDYDLLSRLGFYHDDRFGDDGFGWVDAVDVGYAPGYLGGRVFQPMLPSTIDAAWACAAWRRALHGAQTQLMGVRGQTWLALRAAERAQHVAFLDVCHERSLSARARPCVRHERAGYLQRLEATYRHAVCTAGELRIELRQRAGVDRQDHRHRPGHRHRRTHAQARGAPAHPSAVAATIVSGNRARGRGFARGGLF